MNNELLPIVKKSNGFEKIKNFFRNLFVRNNKKVIIDDNKANIIEEDNINEDNKFLESVKVSKFNLNSFQNSQNKNQFIKQLEKDTSLLENLSIDRLEKLDKYYNDLIESKKMQLKKLS